MSWDRSLREGALVGTILQETRLNSRCLHLIYQGHLKGSWYKDWYKDWLVSIITQHINGGEILFFEMAFEKRDSEHEYEHTHVVIQTSRPIVSDNPTMFWWRYNGSWKPPLILTLKTSKEFSSAKYSLANQNKVHHKFRTEDSMYERYRPRYYIGEEYRVPDLNVKLLSWQVTLKRLVESDSRYILNLFYDPHYNGGKTRITSRLKIADSKRYHIIEGLHSKTLFDDVLKIEKSVWNREVLVLNTQLHPSVRWPSVIISKLLRVVEEAGCKNVWILTNTMPKSLEGMDTRKWRMLTLSDREGELRVVKTSL